MRLIRGLHNINAELFKDGSVVTIGNYDGLHLGHQEILEHLSKQAKKFNLPAVVVVFEPQPEEFFAGKPLPRLMSLRDKLGWLAKYNIQTVLCLPFNAHLAELSAEQFCQQILINALHIKYLVIGDDFVFGHKRAGNFAFLQHVAQQSGFQVAQIPSFRINGVRASSTLIRAALAHGDLKTVAQFLGHNYFVCGKVVHGNKLGRCLGFPTANIHLAKRQLPLAGVFAVKVHGLTAVPLDGVANIGSRPTLSGKDTAFEVYILDFAADIYGRFITIEFFARIRDEKKFSSLEDLCDAVAEDVTRTKIILNRI